MDKDEMKNLFREGLSDQMAEGIKEMARITSTYHRELVKDGMNYGDALLLTNSFVTAWIGTMSKSKEK